MWPRKRLDVRLTDVAYGIYRCLVPPDGRVAQESVEALWSPSGGALACLSVRSGFDLLLNTLNLPAGSEILVSAVTIEHMVDIIRHHRLVPVPVDLDADTLAPRMSAMRRAVTANTRAVLVAHLFGGRFDVAPIADFARDNELLLIEDCAQAFDGGHHNSFEADASLYSFGPIKTCTALGGAIVHVRDPQLLSRMSRGQAALPNQRRREYVRRLFRYAVLVGIGTRTGFTTLVRACRLCGWDYDHFLTTATHSFAGDGFFERIRQQPSAALLALLERRLRRFDAARFADRTAKGELLLSLLDERVFCPGWATPTRTHWVFPILVGRPGGLVADLREAGFDASQSHSLCVVDPPEDRADVEPVIARAMFAQLVFLPLYPEMPWDELQRMARVVIKHAGPRYVPPPAPSLLAERLGHEPAVLHRETIPT